MKTITATRLRQNLFDTLARVAHAMPVRIRYRQGDAILLSVNHFDSLQPKPHRGNNRLLKPLVRGKIIKPLGREADEELRRYMGIA